MSEQNTDAKSLAHTKWNCKYHVVFAPKYRRKVFFQEKCINYNTKMHSRECGRDDSKSAVCRRTYRLL